MPAGRRCCGRWPTGASRSSLSTAADSTTCSRPPPEAARHQSAAPFALESARGSPPPPRASGCRAVHLLGRPLPPSHGRVGPVFPTGGGTGDPPRSRVAGHQPVLVHLSRLSRSRHGLVVRGGGGGPPPNGRISRPRRRQDAGGGGRLRGGVSPLPRARCRCAGQRGGRGGGGVCRSRAIRRTPAPVFTA